MREVHFYPAIRTVSSNTRCFFFGFFSLFFWVVTAPDLGFRLARQILIMSFATQARAFNLSDRNIFYTPGEGEQRQGLMPLGLFLLEICPCLMAIVNIIPSFALKLPPSLSPPQPSIGIAKM